MGYEADRVLVDGYSVIHAWPGLRSALERGTEQARDRLTAAMTRLQDATGVPVTVVFDGRGRSRSGPGEVPAGVEVVFTRKGLTADACIERHVARSGAPAMLLVATNDGAETFTVRALGAQVITAEQLRAWLEEACVMVSQTAAGIRRRSRAKFRQV